MSSQSQKRSSTGNILITAGDPNVSYDITRSAFRLKFPTTHASNNETIGLLNCALYYSWNNLTSNFNNLSGFSYLWNGVSFPVTFPTGFYTIEQLNEYIQTIVMKTNGHYLLDDNGAEVYYLEIQANEVYYACTVTFTPVPDPLPAGWTNPAGVVLNNLSPQMVVDPATNWGKLIGFAAGTYPAAQSATAVDVNGTLVPEISPVANVLILCDWVNDSRFVTTPSVIASFVPDAQFSRLINFTPPVITNYDVGSRNYDSIEIRFVDQLYRPVQIKDVSQSVITLLLTQN